jgi:hypothetical protein
VYAAKEVAPTLADGEEIKMNAQEQENYLRQRVPDGLVDKYVAREQINVQDFFCLRSSYSFFPAHIFCESSVRQSSPDTVGPILRGVAMLAQQRRGGFGP